MRARSGWRHQGINFLPLLLVVRFSNRQKTPTAFFASNRGTAYPIETDCSPHGQETAISAAGTTDGLTLPTARKVTPKPTCSRCPNGPRQEEAQSENDHIVASANGWGCVGTKSANLQGVSQRGRYGSTIGPKAPQNTQARASQGTAPRQARAQSKKSLRRGKTPTKANRRRACTECAFCRKTTVKDELGRGGLVMMIPLPRLRWGGESRRGECSPIPGIILFPHWQMLCIDVGSQGAASRHKRGRSVIRRFDSHTPRGMEGSSKGHPGRGERRSGFGKSSSISRSRICLQ